MSKPLLVAATNNRQKFAELARVFAANGQTLQPYWLYVGRQQFPKEGTADFTNNAEGKARFVQTLLPEAVVIADDSGLLVDALPDHFGITTMRELMAHAQTDAAMNDYILELLNQHAGEPRTATLTTTLTVAGPNETWLTATGQTNFTVPSAPRGNHSVGFDKIMWLPEVGLTLAELPDAARIPFTPRGKAVPVLLEKMRAVGVI
ncbi:non-canonical purine NTP pyrophosphatase [Furfurilactobacillus sp. WILCCON 0119]|uniref:non-canonical purine NTP pyrophosphatase n=1 Tax=Furfurilactobacillus entadae TaxID=2922307 RepID=UPI0035E9210A